MLGQLLSAKWRDLKKHDSQRNLMVSREKLKSRLYCVKYSLVLVVDVVVVLLVVVDVVVLVVMEVLVVLVVEVVEVLVVGVVEVLEVEVLVLVVVEVLVVLVVVVVELVLELVELVLEVEVELVEVVLDVVFEVVEVAKKIEDVFISRSTNPMVEYLLVLVVVVDVELVPEENNYTMLLVFHKYDNSLVEAVEVEVAMRN